MAYAYSTLSSFEKVIRRGRLTGLVRLQQPDQQEARYLSSLTALEGSQAVLDEHFSEEDVSAMADAIAFASPGIGGLDVTFFLQHLESEYISPLAAALERAGVGLERATGMEMEKRTD